MSAFDCISAAVFVCSEFETEASKTKRIKPKLSRIRIESSASSLSPILMHSLIDCVLELFNWFDESFPDAVIDEN